MILTFLHLYTKKSVFILYIEVIEGLIITSRDNVYGVLFCQH